MKIAAYIFLITSIIGIILSVILIIMGNQPCSGDGCMIHFLYLLGTVLLAVSIIIFLLSYRIIKKKK
jgi:hypothetical protein